MENHEHTALGASSRIEPSVLATGQAARPIAADVREPSVLLTPEAVVAVRQANTQKNLQSNKWYEIANIMRWCTTGLIGATMLTIFNGAIKVAGVADIGAFAGVGIAKAAGAIATTIGSGGVVLGLAAAVGVMAVLTVIASQHSRKLFVDKTFDVQDFQMQRQAALVGKSVEHAMEDNIAPASDRRWAQKFAPRDSQRPHTERIQSPEQEVLARATR